MASNQNALSSTATALADTTASTREQAQTVLRELVGHPEAEFHDGQFEAIEALVDGGRRALVVQRTGWGKSAVYFVASLLLRRRGAGPTLIVSPLLALMRDQVAAAARAGVRAVAINSANQLEWDTVREQLAADEVVVVERSFATPVRYEDIKALGQAKAWCFDTYNVTYAHTFFSLDRKRMLCFYELDMKPVRSAEREAGAPVSAIWAGAAIAPAQR